MEHINAIQEQNLSALAELDAELDLIRDDFCPDNEYHGARRALSQFICNALGETAQLSLPDAIDAASKTPDVSTRRRLALVIIHAASNLRIFPKSDKSNQLDRKVIALVENGTPDLARKFEVSKASQNYEKMKVISAMHATICAPLLTLTKVPVQPKMLVASKQMIIKDVSRDTISAYLSEYNQKRVKAGLISILTQLEELDQTIDNTFVNRITDIISAIDVEIEWCSLYGTFLNNNYYSPALKSIQQAVTTIKDESLTRFVTDIRPKRSGKDIAEKHYNLNEVAKYIEARVILTSTGPGLATNVVVELAAPNDASLQYDPRIELGTLPPGDFPFVFSFMVADKTEHIRFQCQISWQEVGQIGRRNRALELHIFGQNPNVDWTGLKRKQPYSTEVAEGDDFVGRHTKVRSLVARFQQSRMGSSFITGQKRVGKTSLARAVESLLSFQNPDYSVSYLEYGQYSRMDPVETLAALGQELADHLISAFDIAPSVDLNFNGSLAPLNKLADLLYKANPNKRIVFILDEFDEIPPEMYRFGPLAETFFSNLRTLSAKKNVAFLLVGGEKMPFVMAAQGDQLNKFVSERLDSFSRTEDWADYVQLLRKPVHNDLGWSDDSIQSMFIATSGHPYYTKLLAARVFETAIAERDAEITDGDVRHAFNLLIPQLDGNSFAHLWKDGISEDRQLSEVLELNRRRFLSACARTLRAAKPLELEFITVNRHGMSLSDGECVTMFHDFVRRRILLQQHEIGYRFSIPLFESWLKELGISLLLTDSLAQEYETSEEKAEEVARVSASELVTLSDRWGPYKGRHITSDQIRAWLEQLPRAQDQRLLYKLLSQVRFVSKLEIRDGLREAHGKLHDILPAFIQEKKSERRRDIIVTYVDGQGKSGATYAALYAEENKLSTKCIIPPESLTKLLGEYENEVGTSIAAIIIVDDVIGSGNSLSGNLSKFFQANNEFLVLRNISVLVVSLTATPKGEQKVRQTLQECNSLADLKVLEPMSARVCAFAPGTGFWESDSEKGRAKDLCSRLGARVHTKNHLGYDDQGLLLVFPETCPNNSLPILHGTATGAEPWRPLFPRL